MTVYVDEYPWSDGKWGGGGHLLTSSIPELHEMADKLGLKRSWFQGGTFPHYDLTKSKRDKAINLGAEVLKDGNIPGNVLMKDPKTGEYTRRYQSVIDRRLLRG